MRNTAFKNFEVIWSALGRLYHFKFFKEYLPQILRGPFLNTVSFIFGKKQPSYSSLPFGPNSLVSSGSLGTVFPWEVLYLRIQEYFPIPGKQEVLLLKMPPKVMQNKFATLELKAASTNCYNS